MRAQVRRVGEAWEYLEKVVLVGTTWTPPSPSKPEPFKERGLKKEWFDWIKEHHKLRLDAMLQALANKVSIFEGTPSVITKLRRWDYGGVFRRADGVPNCGFEKDSKRLQKRVDLLKKAYDDLKARGIDSELKLD
jgi:hypothetical protein